MWATALRSKGFSVHMQQYDHWDTGAEFVDVFREVQKLNATAKVITGEYAIVAKSIGSFIAMEAIVSRTISPTQCVFFGVPFSILEKELSDSLPIIAQYTETKTLIFQNNGDPITPFSKIRNVFSGIKSISCVELVDNTHNYFVSDDLVERVSKELSHV